jgi:phage tail-like protein
MPAPAPAPLSASPVNAHPLSSALFRVEIDGVAAAAFSEVLGIGAEIQTVDIRNGIDPAAIRIDPGERRFENVVLRRGLTNDTSLWDWMRQGIGGEVQRRNISIVLLDDSLNPVTRWNVLRSWPCRYELSPLNAAGIGPVIESLEVCHEGLERA